jgi:RNA-directed DNA polymerase
MSETKPYAISKRIVWKAYKEVKANHGAAGVDGERGQGNRCEFRDS